MNEYLIPANTKKSTLIMGMFRWIDIVILLVGIGISIGLLAIVGDNTWLTILSCLPMLTSASLVFPIPNYHNILVAIQSIIRFFNERRFYIWKGWCVYDEFKEQK